VSQCAKFNVPKSRTQTIIQLVGRGRGRGRSRENQSGMEESATLWSSSVASAENKIKVKHSIFN